MACPDFEQLLDYCEDRVKGPAAQLVVAHLASGCQPCAEDVAWYKRVRALAAGDADIDPPAWVVKRAVQLFEGRAKPHKDDRRDCLIAALVFDSLVRPALSGVRLAETSNQQLLYRAGTYSIDAQITFSGPSRADLIGQVLRESEYGFESVAGLSITVSCDRRAVGTAVTNPVGEFTLNGLAPGEYELTVETSEGMILIPRLPVAPPG
jgi:hypothetical protein